MTSFGASGPRASGKRVAGLFLYPFKSAGGVAVDALHVDPVGARDDRRWMVVLETGEFVSQRTHPRMALLRTRMLDDGVEVQPPDGAALMLERRRPDEAELLSYRVWFSDRHALDCGPEAARWASDFLGAPCRVLQAVRPPRQPLLDDDGRVRAGFADASPALVISTASLTDLNARLAKPLPMDRFRPNIVVEGFDAFEEDRWDSARIGRVEARGRNRCPRCAITLVDQRTGEQGVEPLRTLATYRRNEAGEVVFGMNLSFPGPGVIRVGDPIR